MSITSFIVKRMFARGDKKRDKGLVPPESISTISDIHYGSHQKWQLLDLHFPNTRENKFPTIINIHGGAWVYGDKKIYAPYCMNLAEAGFAVINASYRLAPDHHFPCQIEDVALIVQWVIDHAEEYHLDLDNLFVIGDSVGAHLASMYCCICLNPSYAKQFPILEQYKKIVPKALVLNCGLYEMASEINRKESFLPKLLKDLLGRKVEERDLQQLSPILYLTKDFPTCYVMTGNQDFLREQSYLFKEACLEQGISLRLREYGTENEPQGHVFHLDLRNPVGNQCRQEEIHFIRTHLTIK
ncbi:alpha/beta hydrolase [Streptococcus salivarius]